MFHKKVLFMIAPCIVLCLTACKSDKTSKPAASPQPITKPAADNEPNKPKLSENAKQPVVSKNPNELRVEHRDGGVFIVNSAQKGKIIHADGGVVLVLEEKPSPTLPDSSADALPDIPTAKPAVKPDPNADLGEKIKDYFFAMDNLQAGPVGVKPRKFAEKLLGNMARNNNEDLEKLKSGMDDIKSKMLKMDPPEPCKDYHSLSIELLEGSMEMLDTLKEAVKSSDKDQLNGLVSKAGILKSKTKKLEKLRKAIENKYLNNKR